MNRLVSRGTALAAAFLSVSILFSLSASGQSDWDQPDETLPGFKANNVYHDLGSVDHVNIYNGDTGVVIPLGPTYPLGPGVTWQLKAYNSAKMWTYDQRCPIVPGAAVMGHAVITGYPTLGAG